MNIKAPKNGYVYVYVSNSSDQDVYFDNFKVTIQTGNIIEENHYYSYGLKIAAISSRKLPDANEGNVKNNHQYQGAYNELDEDVSWNDFALRNYDPQIGRWVQQDPFQQFASPYIGMANDPVNNIDPSGGIVPGIVWQNLGEVVIVGTRHSAQAAQLISSTARLIISGTSISLKTALVINNVINSNISTGQVGGGDPDPFQRNFALNERKQRYGAIDDIFIRGEDIGFSGINTANTVKFLKIRDGKFESEQVIEYGNPEIPVITIIKRYNATGEARYTRNSSSPKVLEIQFSRNSNSYYGNMSNNLKEVAENLQANPDFKIDVYGSTNENYWDARRTNELPITIDDVTTTGVHSIDDVVKARQNKLVNDLINLKVNSNRINKLPPRHGPNATTSTKLIIQVNDGLNLPTKDEMRQ